MYPPHSLALKTKPVLEPISLAEVYLQEKVITTLAGSPPAAVSAEDVLLNIYIAAARQWAEATTRRALITQVWTMRLDAFPSSGIIEIPKLEMQSVDSVKYYDEDGGIQTWSDALYQVDINSEPARLQPNEGEAYPATKARLAAVEIEFTAGYGALGADVDQGIIQAMLMLIGHMYQNRETVVVGTIAVKVPMASELLIDPFIDRTETREEI